MAAPVQGNSAQMKLDPTSVAKSKAANSQTPLQAIATKNLADKGKTDNLLLPSRVSISTHLQDCHLKGKFPKHETLTKEFMCLNGSRVQVQTMHFPNIQLQTYSGEGYIGVVLPMRSPDDDDDRCNYVCVIPDDPSKILKMESQLPEIINHCLTKGTKKKLDFDLPIVTHSFEVTLASMQQQAEASLKNFNNKISKSLDEEGVRFVAVEKFIPGPSIKVGANRPFLVAIIDKSQPNILPIKLRITDEQLLVQEQKSKASAK